MSSHRRSQGFGAGGTLLGVVLARVRGADPLPRRRRIFENFQKFLKKIAKMHYFSIFFKKVNKLRSFFARLTKNTKTENFLRKRHYFSIFFKRINKPCVNFLRVWTTKTIYWTFFRKFSKILNKFLQKIAKNSLF